MAIGIQRHGDRAVPEAFLNHFGVDTPDLSFGGGDDVGAVIEATASSSQWLDIFQQAQPGHGAHALSQGESRLAGVDYVKALQVQIG